MWKWKVIGKKKDAAVPIVTKSTIKDYQKAKYARGKGGTERSADYSLQLLQTLFLSKSQTNIHLRVFYRSFICQRVNFYCFTVSLWPLEGVLKSFRIDLTLWILDIVVCFLNLLCENLAKCSEANSFCVACRSKETNKFFTAKERMFSYLPVSKFVLFCRVILTSRS